MILNVEFQTGTFASNPFDEEKIDAMIKRKRKLMEEIVGVDKQHVLKTFSRHELIELLELVETNQEHPTDFDDRDS